MITGFQLLKIDQRKDEHNSLQYCMHISTKADINLTSYIDNIYLILSQKGQTVLVEFLLKDDEILVLIDSYTFDKIKDLDDFHFNLLIEIRFGHIRNNYYVRTALPSESFCISKNTGLYFNVIDYYDFSIQSLPILCPKDRSYETNSNSTLYVNPSQLTLDLASGYFEFTSNALEHYTNHNLVHLILFHKNQSEPFLCQVKELPDGRFHAILPFLDKEAPLWKEGYYQISLRLKATVSNHTIDVPAQISLPFPLKKSEVILPTHSLLIQKSIYHFGLSLKPTGELYFLLKKDLGNSTIHQISCTQNEIRVIGSIKFPLIPFPLIDRIMLCGPQLYSLNCQSEMKNNALHFEIIIPFERLLSMPLGIYHFEMESRYHNSPALIPITYTNMKRKNTSICNREFFITSHDDCDRKATFLYKNDLLMIHVFETQKEYNHEN